MCLQRRLVIRFHALFQLEEVCHTHLLCQSYAALLFRQICPINHISCACMYDQLTILINEWTMRCWMKLWKAAFLSAVISLYLSICLVAESVNFQHDFQTVQELLRIFRLGQRRSRLGISLLLYDTFEFPLQIYGHLCLSPSQNVVWVTKSQCVSDAFDLFTPVLSADHLQSDHQDVC